MIEALEVKEEETKDGRGGKRVGAGRKTNESKGLYKRQKCSPSLLPGMKDLAIKISEKEEFRGWGHVMDVAIALYADQLGISHDFNVEEILKNSK